MIAILYLILAFFLGSGICRMFFPKLSESVKQSFDGKTLNVSSVFLLLPAWLYLGLIPMTWMVYITAYLFRGNGDGLCIGNLLTMCVCVLLAIGLHYVAQKREPVTKERIRLLFRLSLPELVFLAVILYLSVRLFWRTFYVQEGTMYVGLSVFSDFAPHLGMIRSFVYGNNFPTTYSHFAGEDIKYHFMFQFLVGNLEYLGMRIDYAFNVPSTLGFVSTFSLLYVLAARLTGKRAAGWLSCLFFAFRSSLSVFRYLGEKDKYISLKEALWDNSEFLNYSTHEDWGLWNLNVYCNQRHLAFTLGVLILVLLFFLPCLYEAFAEWQKEASTRKVAERIRLFARNNLFCLQGWQVKQPVLAVTAGLLLGMLSFWNGAVTIAALLVLFVLAVFSCRRLEFFITALLAVGLSYLQTAFFIDGNAVAPTFRFGFIAENPTVFGALDYVYRLTGIVLFVVAAAFVISGVEKRIMMIACGLPFLFAFTVSLTPDVTVNHKYIMISLMLLGMFAADALVRLWEQKKTALRVCTILLIVVLTATGLFEYRTVINRNEHMKNLAYNLNDPITEWVSQNATAQDIFLTPNYAIHPVVLGGGMLFDGWQYYAWSAGYDTFRRDAKAALMYEADSPAKLKKLAKENHIRFIVVENANREADNYTLREDVISDTYEKVFEADSFAIYDTQKEK